MRVYLPATAADLTVLGAGSSSGEAPAGPFPLELQGRPAHAVTGKLAAQMPDADQDELEWDAFLAASVEAALMLGAAPDSAPMRVVLSLDLPDAAVQEPEPAARAELNLPPSSVLISASRGAKLQAIHVDEPETAPLITAFRTDPGAPGALEKLVDADLLWYSPTELSEIPIP